MQRDGDRGAVEVLSVGMGTPRRDSERRSEILSVFGHFGPDCFGLPICCILFRSDAMQISVLEAAMIFRQLFDPETSTYTYLLADQVAREAILIDPVLEQFERDMTLLEELGLNLKYVLETHVHADHVTSSGRLRDALGCQIGVGLVANVVNADLKTEGWRLSLFWSFEHRSLSYTRPYERLRDVSLPRGGNGLYR